MGRQNFLPVGGGIKTLCPRNLTGHDSDLHSGVDCPIRKVWRNTRDQTTPT